MSHHSASHYGFSFRGTKLIARADKSLHWPEGQMLCVSDLHFGKAQRYAAWGGTPLPPYDTADTLSRLDDAIEATQPQTVICLGDSFDSLRAQSDLDAEACSWITRLQAGRRWIWIEGNHDPGPVALGGTHRAAFQSGPLTFRHIADPMQKHDISGHYHPKLNLPLKGRMITRPCFAIGTDHVILPSFGAYTGGLTVNDPAISELMDDAAFYVMTGAQAHAVPHAALVRR